MGYNVLKITMAAESATSKLQAAFVEALGVKPGDDFGSMAYGVTAGWDSVAHMALVNAIETAFDIMLATDDVVGMSGYAKAKEIVARYGAGVS